MGFILLRDPPTSFPKSEVVLTTENNIMENSVNSNEIKENVNTERAIIRKDISVVMEGGSGSSECISVKEGLQSSAFYLLTTMLCFGMSNYIYIYILYIYIYILYILYIYYKYSYQFLLHHVL